MWSAWVTRVSLWAFAILVVCFGEGSFPLEPCTVLKLLSSPLWSCLHFAACAGITRSILLFKSKHSCLDECPQVIGGFCFEVGDRRIFQVLSLDMKKGPYLGFVKTQIFQKARELWGILRLLSTQTYLDHKTVNWDYCTVRKEVSEQHDRSPFSRVSFVLLLTAVLGYLISYFGCSVCNQSVCRECL